MLDSGIYNKGSFDVTAILSDFLAKEMPKDAGGVVTFLGVARNIGMDERAVERVEMESYEDHANRVIRNICAEVLQKHLISVLKIYHFVGEFNIGEAMVFVIAVGRHRQETFAAIQEAIERYKTEPALFKKEVYVDGSQEWISHA